MFAELRKLSLGLILLTTVLMTSGCMALIAGAAVGAGGMAWSKGVLEKNVDTSLDKTANAVRKGLKKLKMPILADEKGSDVVKLRSEYPDGRKVIVDVHLLTERASQIRIRVGTFGDRSKSESILTATLRYL